jgi:hypothetical protein
MGGAPLGDKPPREGAEKGVVLLSVRYGHHTICMLDKTFGSVFQGVFALESFVNQK